MAILRLIAALILAGWLAPAHALELKVCVESDDFPPFDFRPEAKEQWLIGNSAGSSIELLHYLGKKLKFSVQLQRLPWLRCLQSVESGAMDMALDAYYSPERAARFDYSRPYYYLTPQIFFLRSRFPHGPPARTIAEMKLLRGCGIHGYAYSHYGLDSKALDLKAQTHEQLIEKLKAGHCDFFLEELEILQGFTLTGKNYLADKQIAAAAVPETARPQLHLLLSRRSRPLQTLRPALNKAIEKYTADGRMIRSVTRLLKN
jgi:polar amino acid transport system substrate-binding protein